jgi:flagellar basal body P-ring formation protein FlgA
MKHIGIYILSIVSLLVITATATAATVTLKNKPVVEGESITFGDIFIGAGEKNDYVIASAPTPGRSKSFKASSVAFVAKKHGLDWNPTSSIKRIVVVRLGQRIPQQHIEQELATALEMELQSNRFELSLSSRSGNIQVGLDESPMVAIESLSYNRLKDSFSAILLAPADAENPKRYKVTGKFYPQTMVPVSTHLIRSGTKIREQDVKYKLVRSSTIGRDVILDIEQLIGRSPRRSVRSGVSFNMNNLGDPVTVSKGKLIAVLFKNGGIALTITGRALENGSEGDVIRVENTVSRKIIQAEVLNEQEVRIITGQQRLANLR